MVLSAVGSSFAPQPVYYAERDVYEDGDSNSHDQVHRMLEGSPRESDRDPKRRGGVFSKSNQNKLQMFWCYTCRNMIADHRREQRVGTPQAAQMPFDSATSLRGS
jgi:hypothetical protein